jgi:hypothetical protein
MIVILDTCEMYSDPRLVGPNFEMLRAYMRQTKSRLILPHVVFEETVNHVRSHLSRHLKEASSSLADSSKILGRMLIDPTGDVNLENEVRNYRDHLNSRVDYIGGSVMGIDSIPVSKLLHRALGRRKPFDGEGKKGFRDAILWETILELLSSQNGEEVVVALVSSNSKDFGTGKLFDDLCNDLQAINRSSSNVLLFNGLKIFVIDVVQPQLQRLEEDQIAQLQKGQYGSFNPSKFFEDYLTNIHLEVMEFVSHYDWRKIANDSDVYLNSPSLAALFLEGMSFDVSDVWILDETAIVAEIEFKVTGSIECSYVDEERTSDGYGGYETYEVEREFEGATEFRVAIKVLLERGTGAVREFRVGDIEMRLGEDWLNLDGFRS